MELNQISGKVIDAAMKVHTKHGPGLLESVYEFCLKYELEKQCLHVQQQVTLPIQYDGVTIDAGYRLDLLVENEIIVELKSVESFIPVHYAQILSYLRLSNKKVGLLLNFNVVSLKDGIKRFVNEY